ncbi:hypothetical protein YC2023_086973 [Brassica napus]
MMGQVDGKPFFKACFARSGGNASGIHYGTHLKFRDVEIKLSGDWGEDVKNAVKTALEGMNEFNASGGFPVPVLWNFEHGRKATLKEGIVAHMKHQINNLKRKRT